MKFSFFRRALSFTLMAFFASSLFSCDDESTPEELTFEPVPFERLMNFNWSRLNVGMLDVIEDRLYYSNELTPGYFTEGTQFQFPLRQYDMRFGHVFSNDFTIGVSENRRSLVVLPNFQYSDNYISFINSTSISKLPSDYLLTPGWNENPNFGINGDFLISSWEQGAGSEEYDRVFILKLNLAPNPGKPDRFILDRNQPISEIIPLDFQIDGKNIYSLISVFPFEEGWLASIDVAGVQTSVQIFRDGKVQPLFENIGRFVLLGVEKLPTGELFVSNENGLYYSESGSPYELTQFASSDQFFRIKFIEEHLVVWAGDDRLFEVQNYRTPSEIKLVALENTGIKEYQIKDIAYFEGKVYVSTNGGLFLKDEVDFWTEK